MPKPPVVGRALAAGLLVLTVTACGTFSGRLPDAVEGAWELRGRIESARAESIDVKHKSGSIVTLLIDVSTVVQDARGRPTTVAAGRRVRAVVLTRDGQRHALRITLFSP